MSVLDLLLLYVFIFILCCIICIHRSPVIIVDKDREVLELMINHGVLEGLCEIFSTSQDEDLLV